MDTEPVGNILPCAAQVKPPGSANLYRCVVKGRSFQAGRR